MTCQECCRLLPEYLEERLPESSRRDVDAHLSGCPECTASLDGQLKDMGELAPVLPRWNMTDKSWAEAVDKGRLRTEQKKIRLFFTPVLRFALAASLILAVSLIWWRTRVPEWQSASVEKRITLSDRAVILLAAGTEYRLEGGAPGDSFFLLNVHRGEAVLSVVKHSFRQAAVVLPTTVVHVTGTFFRVKTVGASDFRVELLEGSVDIETAVRPIRLEQGRFIEKEGERGVIRALTLLEEQSLLEIRDTLLGVRSLPDKEPGKAADKALVIAAASVAEDSVPTAPPAPRPPAAVKPPQTGPAGAKPFSIKDGIEIWDAEINFPAQPYGELGEIEYINGVNGTELQKLAVAKARRMKADGFIILSAGLMGTDVVSEIEFRKSPDNVIEAAGMDLKDYGAEYETGHFAVRKQMRQNAFRMRVKFFKYEN